MSPISKIYVVTDSSTIKSYDSYNTETPTITITSPEFGSIAGIAVTEKSVFESIPVFAAHPSNPLISDCRIYGITEVKKYGENEYRGFVVKQNAACNYPDDFNVDLLTSSDGISWTESVSGILNQNITGKTFNYGLAELKENGVYKAWHAATIDSCIAYDALYYSESNDGSTYALQATALTRIEPYESRNIATTNTVHANGKYIIYYDATSGGHCSGIINNGVAVASSDNGMTDWTKHGLKLNSDFHKPPKVVFSNGKFEAFGTKHINGESVPVYLVSTDGIEWEEVGVIDTLPTNIGISGVVKEGDQYSIWYYIGSEKTFNLATGSKIE
ncbi:MAG: hypothetical protein GY697_20795 [Desulfobacterales bacterium]|nr:hypothetical protein [Desulfobacterales bacterium]